MVAMDQGLELSTGERPRRRPSRDRPARAGLAIPDRRARSTRPLKAQRSTVDDGREDARCADVAPQDVAAVERRGRAGRPEHDDRVAPDRRVRDTGLHELGVREGESRAIALDGHDPFLRREPAVDDAVEEERRAARLVVTDVRVPAVRALMAGIAREDVASGMGGHEIGEGHDLRGQERQLLSGELTDDRLPGRLLPPRFGLAVVHDEVAEAQVAGCAEVVDHSAGCPVEYERGVAERAEGHHDRLAAERVVGDLMPDEDREGVGASDAGDLDRNDR